jgi:hypothetical protein
VFVVAASLFCCWGVLLPIGMVNVAGVSTAPVVCSGKVNVLFLKVPFWIKCYAAAWLTLVLPLLLLLPKLMLLAGD